jgi:hypothetical protein
MSVTRGDGHRIPSIVVRTPTLDINSQNGQPGGDLNDDDDACSILSWTASAGELTDDEISDISEKEDGMDMDAQEPPPGEEGTEIEMEDSTGGSSSDSTNTESSNGKNRDGKKRFSFRRPLVWAFGRVFGSSER